MIIALALAFLTLMMTQTAHASSVGELRQYIAPRECVREIVNDGVTSEVYLTPEECNPRPEPGGGDNGHVPLAPDTGGGIVLDSVHSDNVVVLGVAVMSVLLALLVRRRAKNTPDT